MMTKCPRCGFEQPKDQYCAQCGVDIEKFHIKESPKYFQFLKNPILQIGLILAVVAVTVASFYGQGHFELVQKVKFLAGHLQVSSSNNSSPESTPTNEDTIPVEPNDPNNPVDPNANSLSPAGVATGSPADSATAPVNATNPSATTNATNEKLNTANPSALLNAKLMFLEVPIKVAQRFFQESQMTGQFSDVGGYMAGVLPEIQNKLDSNKGIKILYKIESPIDLNHSLLRFLGLYSGQPERELGIGAYVELTEADPNNVRGNFEVIRSWKDTPESALSKSSYPAIFELPKGSGFFISSVLPHRTFLEMDEQLSKVEPFSILRSHEFKTNQSELFILLMF